MERKIVRSKKAQTAPRYLFKYITNSPKGQQKPVCLPVRRGWELSVFRGVPGCFWQFDRAAPKPGSHCSPSLPDPPKAADFFHLFCSKTEKTPGGLPGVFNAKLYQKFQCEDHSQNQVEPAGKDKIHLSGPTAADSQSQYTHYDAGG